MSQINKYPNRETYASDADRSKSKSSVSYIRDNGELLYEGVNVVVGGASAEIGDLAVYDASAGDVKYIKGATLVRELIPASLTPLAVVYAVAGDRVHVVSLDNATFNGSASVRWAAPYEVALSGFNLAAGGTFMLRINAKEYSFTYAAGATLEDIAANIASNLPGYGVADYGGWTAAATDRAVIMTSNSGHVEWSAIDAVSGCEIRRPPVDRDYQSTLTGILFEGAAEQIRQVNHAITSWAGGNPEKFLQYYSVYGTTATGQKPGSPDAIRESVFTEAANPELVAAYPTYKDYLLCEHMLQYPGAYGVILRDGRENTAKIGGLRFVNIHGETASCYPAAAAALEYGITVEGATTGLEAGGWWLPSVEETHLLMRDRVLKAADAASDPVNRTLVRLGKAACYGSGFYPWTSCEYNYRIAVIYIGSMGITGPGNKYGANTSRPVSILPIKA